QIDSVPVPVLQETLRKSLLAEKIVNCSVSQGEAETYFQKNRSQFYRPALYKLIMMSTDNEADAAAIIKRLRQGEDPRKLAKIYNIFDQMKAVEGDVGWNARSSMSPDAAEAVFDANDGKGLRVKEFTQSPVVYKFKTEQGEEKSQYLVFYAVDYQADSAPSFDEVRTAAYFLARSAKTTQLFSEYFKNHSREIQWVRIKDLTDSQAQANTPQPGTAPAATPADQPK
ncbi:MAG TPA: peptidylprolyl isomerase, partial [Armatimonadota bacterium]